MKKKYNAACAQYVHTDEMNNWKRKVRDAARRASIAIGILGLLSTGSCVAVMLLDAFSDWTVLLEHWQLSIGAAVLGILFSVFMMSYPLIHAELPNLVVTMLKAYHKFKNRA